MTEEREALAQLYTDQELAFTVHKPRREFDYLKVTHVINYDEPINYCITPRDKKLTDVDSTSDQMRILTNDKGEHIAASCQNPEEIKDVIQSPLSDITIIKTDEEKRTKKNSEYDTSQRFVSNDPVSKNKAENIVLQQPPTSPSPGQPASPSPGPTFVDLQPRTEISSMQAYIIGDDLEAFDNTPGLLGKEKKLKCKFCPKLFNYPSHLQRHEQTHTGDKPYRCNLCDKQYSELTDIQRHLLVHTGEKPFKCGICCKSFSLASTLKRHAKTHTGERPFECHFCGKCFQLNQHFQNHVRIHTGEAPYICPVCNKGFKQSGYLKQHLRTHTGERQHRCDVCGRMFSQKGSLRQHTSIHTGDKPFKCDYCGKFFNRLLSLKNHERLHTGHEPFECDLCGKTFKQSGNLWKHKQKHAVGYKRGVRGKQKKPRKGELLVDEKETDLDLSRAESPVDSSVPNLTKIKSRDNSNESSLPLDFSMSSSVNESSYTANVTSDDSEQHANMHVENREKDSNTLSTVSSKCECNICGLVLGELNSMASHYMTHTQI